MFDRNLWAHAKKFSLPLVLTILMGGLIGGLIVGQAWLVSRVISGVFLGGENLADVRFYLIELLAVILIRALSAFGQEVSAGSLSVSVKGALREKLFTHLLSLGPAALEKERTGELSNTLIQGIERLDAYFRQYLPQLALSALVPVTILGFVFPLDWVTGVVFLLTAPLIPLFMVLIAKQAEKETERQWGMLSRLSAHFQDILQGMTTLKSFGRSKQQAQTIQQVSARYAQATLRVLRIAFLSALALEILATISTAIVAVQIGLRLMYAQMSFIDGLFILILAPDFYFPLRQLGASFHAGMDGISAAERIFGLLSETKLVGGQKKDYSLERGIEFKQVSFSYQDGERSSLEQINFEIESKKITALVGASGAGKSTIAALVMGFLRPNEGQVLVGGVPLSEIDLVCWREQVAWVAQFPYMFHTTIEENIRMAKPGASDEDVGEASRLANADVFIRSFSEGYQTVVGERGARLSGGQAQRIALARAFLKDAPMMVLDEPGANLDPESQELLQQALERLLQDRTGLIIAHRLSTVRNADHIVVLDGGRVNQVGTHRALIQEAGVYRELVQAAKGGVR
jgi:ATP-binding cassette subfamily C protein CydD